MGDINSLLRQQQQLLSEIRKIEETCEGIENESNAGRISELNMRRAKLSAEKFNLSGRLSDLEHEVNKINEEIRIMSGTGVNRILQAIKTQRWYFFKNKPKVIMDRVTGILWANLDYFKYIKDDGNTYGSGEAESLLKGLIIDEYSGWRLPSPYELWDMAYCKSFPFQSGGSWRIKGQYYWYVNHNDSIRSKDLDDEGAAADLAYSRNSCVIPCNSSLTTEEYRSNVHNENKVYTEKERLQFTLDIFVNNGLQPIFEDDEITQLYKKIYFEKPELLQKLNELQEQIDRLQQVVLLSSSFDFDSLLSKYDLKAIDASIIKYHKAVASVIDELMDKLHYYEEMKSEIIRDFNVIGLKLSKRYEYNPNLSEDENNTLKKRQAFFKKHFELGMNTVYTRLLAIKKQAEDIEDRIDEINNGENSIEELGILEKEGRASFGFIVENAATIIKNALLKIEFFEENKRFAENAVSLWDKWNEGYKVFKTTLKEELKNSCEDDSIEGEIYMAWYEDWQKKRFILEERFLPLIERGLNGSMTETTDDKPTVIERVIGLLEEYKDGIDKFYIEERKNIYQKFAFQAGGDLQEKFEAESELYKLVSKLQKELQTIIFSLEKSEDRLFLLKWSGALIDLHIDEVLDYVKYKELSKISLEVLTEFADLKRKNYEVYISDSKAYSEELQRREKEYNSLVFKMRKDLMKQ